MKKALFLLIIMTMSFLLYSCEEEEAADIYVTIYPIEFVVTRVVEEELTVKAVYPKGQDVHEYEMSTDNILQMKKGKAIFYIGLGLEPFLESAKESTFKDNNLIAVSDNATIVSTDGKAVDMEKNPSSAYNIDAHIWLDPMNMVAMTKTVLEEVIKLKPEKEEVFKANAAKLEEELLSLDAKYSKALNSEDILNKVILVDHDAYAYWTYRYGVDRIKMRSTNEATEVTISEVIRKTEEALKYNIKYVIETKNEAKCKMFDEYKDRLGAEVATLHHLGTQTKEEAEGENDGAFIDYISIMEYNLDVLKMVLPKKTN